MVINQTINFSSIGYLGANQTILQNTEITIGQLLTDFCSQIDSKIMLCANLIFLFYILNDLIIPNLDKIMFKKLSHTEYIKYNYWAKRVVGYFDTGAIISVMVIIAIGLYQYGFNNIIYPVIVIIIALITKVATWLIK